MMMPNWVVWVFVVLILLWTVYRLVMQRAVIKSLILDKMKAATHVAQLYAQISALQNKRMSDAIHKSGIKPKVVGTVGINTEELSPENAAKIKDLGGTIINPSVSSGRTFPHGPGGDHNDLAGG